MAATASGVKLTESCNGCGLLRYSIGDCSKVIDPERWDGSDLFTVWPMPLFTFLSDRAAKLLREARFSGIRIASLDELKSLEAHSFSPGRLSDHMPRQRAETLGAPLGIA
jgi:hypothetical protein